MILLSHRGLWHNKDEKNSFSSFERSFKLGFGTETDIRDFKGELVISHDIAHAGCLKLEDFLKLYTSINPHLFLALNIKADGLQNPLKTLLEHYKIQNYFVFDMSVPDALVYLKTDIKSFTRQSEYEKEPSFYELACGIWLDEFHSHWINKSIIQEHLAKDKFVCIVSPDLHQREYLQSWQEYKLIDKELKSDKLMLCTDHILEAREFFDAN